MTLKAFAPNGLEITHEYWFIPYATPVKFKREDGLQEDDEGYMAPGITAVPDYTANEDGGVCYQGEGDGQNYRKLQWQDTDGNLWASEDLTFKEVDDD